jgi:hypothetical protein
MSDSYTVSVHDVGEDPITPFTNICYSELIVVLNILLSEWDIVDISLNF